MPPLTSGIALPEISFLTYPWIHQLDRAEHIQMSYGALNLAVEEMQTSLAHSLTVVLVHGPAVQTKKQQVKHSASEGNLF